MEFNPLIPELTVKNLEKSKKFYLEVLGFILEYERIEDNFAFISYNGAQIMLEQANGNWETSQLEYPFGRGVNFQIKCENVKELYEKIEGLGYNTFRKLYEAKYRQDNIVHTEIGFLIQDPDGYLLRFSQSGNC